MRLGRGPATWGLCAAPRLAHGPLASPTFPSSKRLGSHPPRGFARFLLLLAPPSAGSFPSFTSWLKCHILRTSSLTTPSEITLRYVPRGFATMCGHLTESFGGSFSVLPRDDVSSGKPCLAVCLVNRCTRGSGPAPAACPLPACRVLSRSHHRAGVRLLCRAPRSSSPPGHAHGDLATRGRMSWKVSTWGPGERCISGAGVPSHPQSS